VVDGEQRGGMRLHCVLGKRGVDCEYYDCGECKESWINAYTNARIENMEPGCQMFRARTKECSICGTEAHHHHYDKSDILCENCSQILYECGFISVAANLKIRKEALKKLIARVRKDEHSKCPKRRNWHPGEKTIARQDTGTHA